LSIVLLRYSVFKDQPTGRNPTLQPSTVPLREAVKLSALPQGEARILLTNRALVNIFIRCSKTFFEAANPPNQTPPNNRDIS
jgi:hypothetical protein